MAGLLTELREAAPLAERLADAAAKAEEHFAKAVAAAETTPQGPDPSRPPGSQPPIPPPAGPQFYPPPKEPDVPGPTKTASAGPGGGGGGTMTGPTSREISSVPQPGPDGFKFTKPLEWVAAHCKRRDPIARIPNPRNRNAFWQNDFKDIGGWDCSEELGYTAIFYDPDEMAALEGHDKTKLISSTSSGGGNTPGRPKPPPTTTVFLGDTTPSPFGFGPSGSTAPTPPPPPPGSSDPGIKQALQEQTRVLGEQNRLLREIRDQGRIGDASLAQRVGGRP